MELFVFVTERFVMVVVPSQELPVTVRAVVEALVKPRRVKRLGKDVVAERFATKLKSEEDVENLSSETYQASAEVEEK